MAKPDGALDLGEIANHCDLSSFAFFTAKTILDEHSPNLKNHTYTLTIPSQQIIVATFIKEACENFYIDLSLTYDQDEWSFTREDWDIIDGEIVKHSTILWSEGA